MTNCPICNNPLNNGMCIKEDHSTCIGKTSIGITQPKEDIYYYYINNGNLVFANKHKEYKAEYTFSTFKELKLFCETLLILT